MKTKKVKPARRNSPRFQKGPAKNGQRPSQNETGEAERALGVQSSAGVVRGLEKSRVT